MSGLVDGILGQLGPAGMAQIAKSLGADEGAVGTAVSAALPAIIAGMANNARQPTGAESLANALNDHSPSIFDSLGGLLSGFFGGLSGHQGALRSAFLAKAGLTTERFVGSNAVIGFLVDLTRIAVYVAVFAVVGDATDTSVWPLVITGCSMRIMRACASVSSSRFFSAPSDE